MADAPEPPSTDVTVLAPVLPKAIFTELVLPIVIAPTAPPAAEPESMLTAPDPALVESPDLMVTVPVGDAPVPVALPDRSVSADEAVPTADTSIVLSSGDWMLVP